MSLKSILQGKSVAVMGLGKSGTSAARVLQASGARPVAWDDNEKARAAGQAAGLAVGELTAAALAGVELLVWSPGIAHTHPQPHPVAERARKLGIPLVCDIELLCLANPQARFIGITGTNGKSTTTTLIGHILAAAGQRVATGGNLGTPALDLPALGQGGTYVLELSSYQLELLDRARFDVGVLLNITPDHLGRHGGMDGYVAAKAGLFRHLSAHSTAVVGIDDEFSRGIRRDLPGTADLAIVPVSVEGSAAGGISATNGRLVDDSEGKAQPIIDLAALARLPGRHNWQNACAAYAAARAAGVAAEKIVEGLKSYPGLAHRQDLVGVIDGIAYVNDSKATNADAVAKALVCYDAVYWILGGQAKEGGITSLVPLFPRVAKAFLIGEASDQFAATLKSRHVPFEVCGTLDVALAKAREAAIAAAKPGAVVLLSPACASWDQFKSFEHRGDAFRQMVAALPGERGRA